MYGEYYASLEKQVRTELAEANALAGEVLGSMATIKAHAAEVSTRSRGEYHLGDLMRGDLMIRCWCSCLQALLADLLLAGCALSSPTPLTGLCASSIFNQAGCVLFPPE